jgi:hypothetical protein
VDEKICILWKIKIMRNIAELEARVHADGVATFQKAELTKLIGRTQKVGRVSQAILRKFLISLGPRGIGFVLSPLDVLDGDFKYIRLFSTRSLVADTIGAVIEMGETNDKIIRKLAGTRRKK